MRWPDIFFKAKPARRDLLPEKLKENEARRATSKINLPPAPLDFSPADDTVIKDMAEADTVREMTRSGGVRLVKRDFPSELDESPPVVTDTSSANFPEKKPERAAPAINLSGPLDPKAVAAYPSATTIFPRRTKIADVARIVLPPRREETSPAESSGPAQTPGAPKFFSPPESASTVIPASFPVNIATGNVLKTEAEASKAPEVIDPPESQKREASLPEPDKKIDEPPASPPVNSSSAEEDSAKSNSITLTATTTDTREKREFVLSNGERILGHILSETPESIYIDHGTLGVLTLPRAQIAQRPVEIILINGDRVVGDIIAETSDSLFVRHASLGILTVPRSQRSTRVVEAILKDGDRILGEVLGETENFTVIRSATLGTVAVPHDKVAMLNRRAEQVEIKALPPPTPQLENKPAA